MKSPDCYYKPRVILLAEGQRCLNLRRILFPLASLLSCLLIKGILKSVSNKDFVQFCTYKNTRNIEVPTFVL
jgi:hypothetical protein